RMLKLHNPRDLGDGHLLKIIEIENRPLDLGHTLNRERQYFLERRPFDDPHWRFFFVVRYEFQQARLMTGAGNKVKRLQVDGLDSCQPLLIDLELNPKLRRDVLFERLTSIPLFCGLNGSLDLFGSIEGLARRPVGLPQAVHDGPTNPMLGKAVELNVLGGIKTIDRLQEPHHSRRDQVVQIEIVWELSMDAARDYAHLLEVLHYQSLTIQSEVLACCKISVSHAARRHSRFRPRPAIPGAIDGPAAA